MSERRELVLPVKGMTCASCVSHVEKALGGVQGVSGVNVNLATEKARLWFDTDVLPASLVEAVRSSGYEVVTESATYAIGGMTCASCASHVQKALSKVPGVLDATVNLATERATVSLVPGTVDLPILRAAVAAAGYELTETETDAAAAEAAQEDEAELKMAEARRRMWIAWAFTSIIVVWMLADMFMHMMWPSALAHNLGMILLALPVLGWVGRHTFKSGIRAALHGYANMDTLIALGTGVSFLSGPVSFIAPVANYAGIAAMIMAFHLTGRYVEESAKGRASKAIRKLLELGAKTASVERDGREVEITIDQVVIGDVMVVRPGEKIPTDGVVVSGVSAVDE